MSRGLRDEQGQAEEGRHVEEHVVCELGFEQVVSRFRWKRASV
jgi:hypothetical protein